MENKIDKILAVTIITGAVLLMATTIIKAIIHLIH